jgi:Carboxypeptidase regulatory-like domain
VIRVDEEIKIMSSASRSAWGIAWVGVVVLAMLCGMSANVSAQDVASLTGVVTDPTGAVVAGIDVKLLDTKTNTAYQTKTNALGAYLFSNLKPGPGWQITFTREGFETLKLSDVYLAVNSAHTQNAQLKIGAASETVEVSGAGSAVTLDTTDTTIGNNFDMRTVHDLPVLFRDSIASLVQFQPGVVNAASVDDPNNSRAGAVTGSRVDQGNITLDGIDVNDFGTGQAFVATANAPVDSIQEFRGETANPLSTEGRGSGAQISIVTKSGTNEWHGSASEYFRNTVTEANDYFNIQAGIPRTQLNRNQFGVTLGGPIRKDKAFFFINYNGRRDAQTDNVLRTVPLDSSVEPGGNLRNGGVAYINSNPGCDETSRINTTPNCISQLSSAAIQSTFGLSTDNALVNFVDSRYPLANDLTAGDGINTGGFRFSAPDHLSENNLIAKVDYNANSKHKLFAKYSIIGEKLGDNVNGATIQFPGDPITHFILDTSYTFSVGDTWTISPNKVNQFVFGEARSRLNFPVHFNPAGANDFSIFANNGSNSPILDSPYSGQNSQRRDIPIPVFRDDFSYQRGTHNIQLGGTFKPISALSNEVLDLNQITVGLGGALFGLDASVRPVDLLQDQFQVANTEWDTSLAFAVGRIGQVQQNLNYNLAQQPLPQDSGDIRKWRYYETEIYAQDTWRMRSDLTLTYGVRWQYYSVPYETQGYQSIANIDADTYFKNRVAAAAAGRTGTTSDVVPFLIYTKGGKANHAPGYYAADWRDFAPRVSFAYNPAVTSGLLGKLLGDRKTVIRAGGGIVFDHPGTEAVNFEQNRNSYLFNSQTTTSYGAGESAGQALANDPTFQSVTGLPSNLVPPTQPTIPFTPFVDANGNAFGESTGATFNYAIDPHLKTPYNIIFSFGIQRELPGKFQLDVNYFGRLGRRLLIQADEGQTINFTDPQSGHTLAGDFAALSAQVRPATFNGTVTPQPFFENQVNAAALANYGADCTGFGEPNCTQLLYDNVSGLVTRGDLSDSVAFLNQFALLASGIGLAPQFDTNVYVTNKSYSSYNGLLTTLHKKMSNGLQFDLNYTYAHSIDNASVAANSFFTDFVCDVTNLKVCKGDSDFDVRHAISMTGIYELPFGRGRMFGGSAPALVNHVIGGWTLAGTESWRTGLGFRTGSSAFPIGFATVSPGIFNGDTNAIKAGIHTDASNGNALQFFANPTAAIGSFSGPLGLEMGSRNNLHGPGFSNTDLALIKNVKLTERVNLEFHAEAFNVFNHPSFSLPLNGSGGVADFTLPSSFGVITTTSSSPREMQFALRLEF